MDGICVILSQFSFLASTGGRADPGGQSILRELRLEERSWREWKEAGRGLAEMRRRGEDGYLRCLQT